MEHKHTVLIGETFTRRHPTYKNETRTLKITGIGSFLSGYRIVECQVIQGRGDRTIVDVADLPKELLSKIGAN